MTRNRQDALAIREHDMLALTRNPKSALFKHPNSVEVVDTGEFRHRLLSDFDFTHISVAQKLVAHS